MPNGDHAPLAPYRYGDTSRLEPAPPGRVLTPLLLTAGLVALVLMLSGAGHAPPPEAGDSERGRQFGSITR